MVPPGKADGDARAAFRRSIVDTLQRDYPAVSLRGSVARGDFHLVGTGDRLMSYSDVDLIQLGISEKDRQQLGREIGARLQEVTGVRLHVSVQPHDYFSQLPEMTSRMLQIGEFLRRYKELEPGDPQVDYLRAKCALRLAHAGSVRVPAAQRALERAYEVKLGSGTGFAAADFIKTGVMQEASPHEVPYLQVPAGQASASLTLREHYARQLSDMPGMAPWLLRLMVDLVIGKSGASGGNKLSGSDLPIEP